MATEYDIRCVGHRSLPIASVLASSEAWPRSGVRHYAIPVLQGILSHRSKIEELDGLDFLSVGLADGVGHDELELPAWLVRHHGCDLAIFDEYGRPLPFSPCFSTYQETHDPTFLTTCHLSSGHHGPHHGQHPDKTDKQWWFVSEGGGGWEMP
jgi:hypothetical protein